jgi:hypothetical protein
MGWLFSKHMTSIKRQAAEFMSCPNLAANNGRQSRMITGLLNGHEVPSRRLFLKRLIESALCNRSEAEEGTSAHVLCNYELLATVRYTYLRSPSVL